MPKLNVPYRSQWAEDAASHNADCGPTCVAMILNHYGVAITPDDGYDVLSQQFGRTYGARQYTTTYDLRDISRNKNIPADITWFANRNDALAQLKLKINQNKPFITLVNYAPWRRVTGNSFSGSHFVVVTGYDDQNIYMHDPLFGGEQPLEKGVHFKMSTADFMAGWGGFNNPDYSNNRNGNPDWLLIYPLSAPAPASTSAPAPAVNQPAATTPSTASSPPQTVTAATTPSNTTTTTRPMQPSNPTPDLTDEIKRRVEALAGWHWLNYDWNNAEITNAWLNHLGDFGKVTKFHKVVSGDTLSGLSGQYYRRQDKWKAIMGYNRLHGEFLMAGQSIRIPMPGDDTAHTSAPNSNLIMQSTEAEEFHDPDIEADTYESLAENSLAMGAIELDTVDDSEAAGFSSTPNVVTNDIVSGHNFTATWTFRNSGSTMWNSNYKIVYVNQSHPSTDGALKGQMSAKNAYSITEVGADQLVLPGETMSVTVPLIAPAPSDTLIASHWQLQNPAGENFGALRWLTAKIVPGAPVSTPVDTPTDTGSGTTHQVFMPFVSSGGSQPQPIKAKTVEFGMNINPNLDSPGEIDFRDVNIEHQRGLGWIRYAYWGSRNRRGAKEAYVKRYRQLIKTYADAGIKTLIVMHQDLFWGNGPWDNGGWGPYTAAFGRECAEVAAACAEFKGMVAYQIFNETDSRWGDDAANPNKSAIGLAPDVYARILDNAAKSIRAVDPDATIVASGMKTGPHNAVNYLKQVQAALKKPLPVDALAYHPYGRHALTKFDFAPFGSLAESFVPFAQAFPNLPIWLTEIGVPGHEHVFPPNRYPEIAKFMNEAINAFKVTHAAQVPVIIWFAWSDFSENSGIVTKDGRMKDGIADAYQKMRNIS
jgi:nucleoid-associated protein YgaU